MTNHHYTSSENSVRVTGADQYRISFVGTLVPEHPRFAVMEEWFLPEHRRPDGYGLAFLESEEHAVVYVGAPEQIHAHRAAVNAGNEAAVLDCSLGQNYGGWPNGEGWDDLIPPNTWNPTGEGIITEFDHRGGKVVVYEFLVERDGAQVSRVAFHCEYCHISPEVHFDHVQDSRGPQDRRWIARKARLHIRGADHECRRLDPRFAEVVASVSNQMHGTNRPAISEDSYCATTGPCSQIRILRARAAATSGRADGGRR